MPKSIHTLLLLAGLVTVCVSTQNTAWAIQAHEAEVLQFNDKLTLSLLLTTTLERHPQAGVLAARSATIDAETKYGNRWLPDSTELTAFHLSDRSFDDVGNYENEVALSFPMWLPGEKRAQSRLGEVLAASRASGEAEFRWRVSGQLRQQLWQLKLAVRQWQLAVEHEQRLGEVLAQWKSLRSGKARRCYWRQNTWMPFGYTARSQVLRTFLHRSMKCLAHCRK
jgi:hypothetical protein